MDYRSLSELCSAITPKPFTFDYSALPRWYGQAQRVWNADPLESEVLDAPADWMCLPGDVERRSFGNYTIPVPNELHPARVEAHRPQLDEVVDQIGGRARCYSLAHAYLPKPQWKRRLAVIGGSRADGCGYRCMDACRIEDWRC